MIKLYFKATDMLMIMYTPNIREVLETIMVQIRLGLLRGKSKLFKPKRVQDFRGFILDIPFEIEPTTGHHVSIGKDRITFQSLLVLKLI